MTTEEIRAIQEAERIISEAPNTKPELYTEPEIPTLPDVESLTPEQLNLFVRRVLLYHDLMDREITGLKVYLRTGTTAPARHAAFWTLRLPYVGLGTRLVFSKRAMAIVSSLLLATVASLSALLYGALTSTWLALWGGGCLLALVIYEILRLNQGD